MRAARVPASLAISSAAHYIITATDHSESYQLFMQKHKVQQQHKEMELSELHTNTEDNNVNTGKSNAKRPLRFRLHHLIAADWSELMHKCRRITHPANAYTISSPGDAGDVISSIFAENAESNNNNNTNNDNIKPNETHPSMNTEVHVVNTAIMHIVERVPSDFVPNNLIYHRLRQYDIESINWHGIIPGFDEFVWALQHNLSVDDTSEKAKQRDAQREEHTMQSKVTYQNSNTTAENRNHNNNNLVQDKYSKDDDLDEELNVPANDKREHDALTHNSEAQIASVSNEQVGAYINTLIRQMQATLEHSQKSMPSEVLLHQEEQEQHKSELQHQQTLHSSLTFTFYPHRIDAVACIPFCSTHFAVLVNLKPIVPLHLMVVPLRCVSTIHGLSDEEVNDWGNVVHLTIRVLEHIRQERCSPYNAETASTTNTQSSSVIKEHSNKINNAEDTNNIKPSNGAVNKDTEEEAARRKAKVQDENNVRATENKQKEQEREQCGVVHDGGYSIAIQQGALAGQTVAHLHTHVIPFDPTGVLAGEPEYEGEAEAQRRPPRTVAEMREDTSYLRPYFAKFWASN